jgi:hypothetical protein
MPIGCAILLGAAQRAAAGDVTNLTVEVAYTNRGQVAWNGQAMDVARLPKKLKSLGATADTTITIGIPADAPAQWLMALSRELTAAGLRRFIFAKPRQISATAESASPQSEGSSVTYGSGSRAPRGSRK